MFVRITSNFAGLYLTNIDVNNSYLPFNILNQRKSPYILDNSILLFFSAQPTYARCRQNSVFVESQYSSTASQKPSRKYQSAMDLSAMVLDEAPEPV